MQRPHRQYRRLRTAPQATRLVIGLALIVGGVFGFLPVLGFWMIPLGIVVIFIDVPLVRRAWTRVRQWWKQRVRVGNRRGP